ncbi:hypothetical protein GCM10029992_09430 [Glycomyces albus]
MNALKPRAGESGSTVTACASACEFVIEAATAIAVAPTAAPTMAARAASFRWRTLIAAGCFFTGPPNRTVT